jgi:signal peptidase I
MNKILFWFRDFIYGKDFASKSKTKDYFLIPFYALLVAVVFRSFLFDNFHIPSGSMKNTLLIGDKITVSMYSYGYSRYSVPFGIIPFEGRIFEKNNPQRGDIVVFKYPVDRSTNYVKRLIGLPGDKIRVLQGNLYINGVQMKREFVQTVKDDEIGFEIELSEFTETLPEGKSYNILKYYLKGEGYADNTKEFTVPEKHYFFMGDNRDFSKDSRFPEVGFVQEDLILGRVERILISSPSSLLNVFDWHNIRFKRIWQKP